MRLGALRFPLAGLLLVGACAPATPLSSAGRESRVTVATEAGASASTDLRLRRDDLVVTTELQANRAALWSVLAAAYVEIGLPEPTLDGRSWTARLASHSATRRIGPQAMSRFLECGSSISGLNADVYSIQLSVQTALEAVGDGTTRVHSRVEAVAVNRSGVSSNALPCSSTGQLERRLSAALAERAR
jgi:hypothetical protein